MRPTFGSGSELEFGTSARLKEGDVRRGEVCSGHSSAVARVGGARGESRGSRSRHCDVLGDAGSGERSEWPVRWIAQSSGALGIVIWIDARPTAPGAATNLIVLVPSTRPLGPTRDETFFLDLGFVFPLPSENVADFPFDIARFPWARAGFAVMGQGGSFNASGPVTRLQVVAAPEPGALALLGLGLVAVGLRRSSRRS